MDVYNVPLFNVLFGTVYASMIALSASFCSPTLLAQPGCLGQLMTAHRLPSWHSTAISKWVRNSEVIYLCTFCNFSLLKFYASPCDKLPYWSCRGSVSAQDQSFCLGTLVPVHEIPRLSWLSCGHQERHNPEAISWRSSRNFLACTSQVNLCLLL